MLEEIGQKLKAAREGQGLSLAQIYERTKIPVNHLEAIDSGVPDDLPEPVYVAGFIKRYADCVGLNGQSLSDEYRQTAATNPKNGDSGWAARAVYTQPAMVSQSYMKKARVKNNRVSDILATGLWSAIMLVMLIGLVVFLVKYSAQNSANQPDSSLSSLTNSSKFNQVQPATSQTPTGPTQAGPETTTVAPDAAPQAESKVWLTASQHVWVDVTSVSTGASQYTGFLEAGDRRQYSDPQGVRVHAGNGASVTVEVDGKSQTLGAPGKPCEKLFMSKTATANAAGTDPSTLGVTGAATPVKPVVKKVAKRPPGSETASAAKKRYRALDEMPGRGHIPGEFGGGTRSIDVPYRYTE